MGAGAGGLVSRIVTSPAFGEVTDVVTGSAAVAPALDGSVVDVPPPVTPSVTSLHTSSEAMHEATSVAPSSTVSTTVGAVVVRRHGSSFSSAFVNADVSLSDAFAASWA